MCVKKDGEVDSAAKQCERPAHATASSAEHVVDVVSRDPAQHGQRYNDGQWRISVALRTSPPAPLPVNSMPKRVVDDAVFEASRPSKRLRVHAGTDYLSRLSDELLLRIFSNLDVKTVLVNQRVSRKLQSIAVDSELWKGLYYDNFIRPRKQRFPGRRSQISASLLSLKPSKWTDEQYLIGESKTTGWKQQYKLRHNWTRGSCDSSEIIVASPPVPPLMARLHNGIVYTVDSIAGIRAWSYKKEQRLVASLPSSHHGSVQPCSLTVDTSLQADSDPRLSIGYQDGSFQVISFSPGRCAFTTICTHTPASNGALSALAFTWPYLLTATDANLLSLYHVLEVPSSNSAKDPASAPSSRSPTLLASLKSHSVWPPLSLALRLHDDQILASVAYSFPTFAAGWSAGIQDIRFSAKGEVIRSRTASAVDQGFVSLAKPRQGMHGSPISSTETTTASKPTSLSYSHPYLLVSHADNTLTVYVVTSNATTLSISAGKTLWGHTSSVFGAHIGRRGKAVSVSTRGAEVRIWELEGSASRAGIGKANFGVPITPEKRSSTSSSAGSATSSNLATVLGSHSNEPTVTRAWVGFDDESVIVLREHAKGDQALTVYDFT